MRTIVILVLVALCIQPVWADTPTVVVKAAAAIEAPGGGPLAERDLRIQLANWLSKGRYRVLPEGKTSAKYRVVASTTSLIYYGGGGQRYLDIPRLGRIELGGNQAGWFARPQFEFQGPRGMLYSTAEAEGAAIPNRADSHITIDVVRQGRVGSSGYAFADTQSLAIAQAIQSISLPPEAPNELEIYHYGRSKVIIRAAIADINRIQFRLTSPGREELAWRAIDWHRVTGGYGELEMYTLRKTRSWPSTLIIYWDGERIDQIDLEPQ